MFDEVLDVVIVAVVALLGLAAGFALGKMRGQASARMAKASEVDALRGSCEAMKDDNARLAAQVAQAKAQSEGLLQQLSFAKSQLAQAQQAEQVRVQRERERAEADGLRRREEQEKALTEQGKVLSALAPLQKNLDELQQKVSNIEEGRKHEMGVLGEQLKGLGEQQARLDRETSSLSAALRKLYEIDSNRYAFLFEEEVYRHFTSYALDQSADRLKWGTGRIIGFENFFPVVTGLLEKEKMGCSDFTEEIAQLEAAYERQSDLYRKEIDTLCVQTERMERLLREAGVEFYGQGKTVSGTGRGFVKA